MIGRSCAECGAPLPEHGSCEDYFHELLLLEGQVPGAPGAEPHFLAVASYNLQHPSSFTLDALVGLRRTLTDVLARRANLDDARRRARAATSGATRVRRRPDDALSDAERAMLRAWPTSWPATVLDVCRVRPEEYVERVRAWASSVSSTLERMAKATDL